MSGHDAFMVAQQVEDITRVVRSLTNLLRRFCGVLRPPSINPRKHLCVQILYIDMKRTGIRINNESIQKFIITTYFISWHSLEFTNSNIC